MKNTLEELIKYCVDKNRVCPMPIKWVQISEIISVKPGYPGNHVSLSPLILGGWDSSNEKKRDKLKTQIEYVAQDPEIYQELEKFILNLKDDEWYYSNSKD